MKKLFTFIAFASVFLTVRAQNLVVQQEGGKLYVNHTVAPKENWYSVGRMFNLSPNTIAPFNGLTMDKGLGIGQKLKIPLTSQNLAQSGQPAADEAYIPLYHTVKEKEGLYRIGQTYNKVSVDQIKQWNKLKSDEVAIGTNLIVGYLKVKKDLSPLAGAAVQVPSQPTVKAAPAESAKPAEEKTVPPPTVKTTTTPPANNPPTAVTTAPVTKTTPPPANTAPVTKTTTPAPVNTAPATKTDEPTGEGAFATAYRDQSKGTNQVTGTAGIFKSTSGWKDAKYYVLMNKVTPGTIVKITAISTNKAVYAKVLGEIPPGKENEGLLIRLSNAASAQLQVPDSSRFDVQLQY